MNKIKRIIIVGHPGAGKAVLGKAVADKLNWNYIDADFGIEYRSGWTATHLLGSEGNTALRSYENTLLTQYKNDEHHVIVTDAGIVTSKENLELLNTEYVVFLTISLTVQLERFQRGIPPLMPGVDLKALLEEIHQRDDVFTRVANITLSSDEGDIDSHVDAILADAKLLAPSNDVLTVKLENSDRIQLHKTTYESIHLSEQQATCLKLLAHGKSAKEIARDLDISYRTVEGHITHLKNLLGCSSSKELISLYLTRQP